MRAFAWIAMVLAVGVSMARAEVRVEIRADGSKVITNLPRPGEAPPRRPLASLPHREPPVELSQLIDEHSQRADLDPGLVRAVVRVESDFDPAAVSVKGAIGLMQLMPETARELSIADPYDPAQNLAGGTRYLRDLLDRFDGSLELALAGYNAGPEAVLRYGGVPPYRETRDYVRRILDLYDGPRQLRSRRAVSVERSPGQRLMITNTRVSGS